MLLRKIRDLLLQESLINFRLFFFLKGEINEDEIKEAIASKYNVEKDAISIDFTQVNCLFTAISTVKATWKEDVC